MAGTSATVTIPSSLFLNNTSSLFFHSQRSCSFFKLDMEKRALRHCSAKKKLSYMDQILHYIEGPKLRRWYGAPDLLPKDESSGEEDDQSEGEEVRDAVLVTDGDSDTGQMVILSLIVKRARVKALVKDKRAALEAFGTYVESIAGDAREKPFLRRALSGVRTVICPNEGFLSNVGELKGLQHIILLSQPLRDAGGVQALINSTARNLAEQDESKLVAAGIPYTIIRAGLLQSTPGGRQGFSFEQGSSARGNLSKEDAAFICVEAVNAVPQRGSYLSYSKMFSALSGHRWSMETRRFQIGKSAWLEVQKADQQLQ